MRVRILTTGLVTAALAACSEPAPEPVLDRAEEAILSARLELALSAAAGAESPVASDLEINLPPQPQPERPRTQPVRQKVAPVASAPAVQPMEVEAQHDHAVAPDPQPTIEGAVLHPRVDAETAEESGPAADPVAAPAAPAEGGRGKPMPGDVADDGRSGPGRGPIVIIRGGGSGRDPCAVHMPRPGRGGIPVGLPGGIIQEGMDGGIGGIGSVIGAVVGEVVGRGAGGALINERVPRTGPTFNAPRTRTGGSSMPRGRGGIRF